MEERPLGDPATHTDLSPEARRRDARRRLAGLPAQIGENLGPGSRFFAVGKRVWIGTYYDGFIHAGNLAYMSLLALFPFFIAAGAILAAIGEPSQREASIDAFLFAVPTIVADVIEPVARDAVAARSGWLLWIGGAFGLWSATSLLETIRDILHRAYGTPLTEAFWRHRLFSTGVIFAAVVLLLLSFFLQIALIATEEAIAAWFPWLEVVLEDLSVPTRGITAVVLYASFLLLFLSLTPSTYRGKRYPKWPGALLITLWWTATTQLLPGVLRLFFTYDLTYGSLAGVMIALFFFWLVGLGVVVGAELNAALAETPEERQVSEQGGSGSGPANSGAATE